LARKVGAALILLDIQLSVMDGYAVAEELRKQPALDDIPIVAVTSYAMTGDRARSLAAGCPGHIEKPINPETFMNDIQKYLNCAPGNDVFTASSALSDQKAPKRRKIAHFP